jgi:hypothetical protein
VPGEVRGVNVVTEGVGYDGDAGSGVGACDVTGERGTGVVLIPGVCGDEVVSAGGDGTIMVT